jgi:hypothetical protein
VLLSLSPILVAILIAGVVTVVGIVLNSTRRDATFSGFEASAYDLRRIRRRVNGQLRREGKDLVISGDWRSLPVTLRFSHRDDAPAVHVRIAARATFAFDIVSPSVPAERGRAVIRIPELRLEPRFVLRTDSPAEARLFTGTPKVRQLLQAICTSTGISVAVEPGTVEVAQMAFPQHYLARRVLQQLERLGDLAAAFEVMPRSDLVRVPAVTRNRSIVGRAAMVTGLAATVVVVATASYPTNRQQTESAEQPSAPTGIDVSDALHIPGILRWRLAEDSDYDPGAVRWLRNRGQTATTKIGLDLGGNGSHSVAYFLKRQGSFRVVMLDGGEVKYDASYPFVAVVTRVPAQALSQIDWTSAPTAQPDGEGLLLIMNQDDVASSLLLFSHAGRVLSAAPANYQSIPLE